VGKDEIGSVLLAQGWRIVAKRECSTQALFFVSLL
jgi:hypothetical protein